MLLRINKTLLGLGHPRTGTGYTSKLLQSWGLKVGHEWMEKDGIVAWQLINPIGPWPYMGEKQISQYYYNFKHIIYNVRNPYTSIPSIVYTEDDKPESVRFRRSIGVGFGLNPVENAIKSIIFYDNIVSHIENLFTYRIEDQSSDLYNFLTSQNLPVIYNNQHINIKSNTRSHKNMESLENNLHQVDPYYKQKLNNYCQKYGYDKLF